MHDDTTPLNGAQRIAVGMSGGLDSSVAAALCVDEGREVIGLTLHMFKEGSRCCSIEDVERARRLCEHLGIRHYVINAIEWFEANVIRHFVEEYARGRTPSPCVLCNEFIKFGMLHERAGQLGCSAVATGHYARVESRNGSLSLERPTDRKKDQTYFLHRLSQEQLKRSLFPLAGWTKEQAAKYAAEKGLPIHSAAVSESQDLCFVPDDGHAAFVEARRPDLKRGGQILDAEGKLLGRHEGCHRYTLGQRRGLGVAAPTRLYVQELDAEANRVVLGAREDVLSRECLVEDVHWISGAAPADQFSCTGRVRYRHEAAAVHVTILPDQRMQLEFEEPQFAITPGQAAVLYDGETVLGGGWIADHRESFRV